MSTNELFLETVQQVAGQPLAAAGYVLEDRALHHARGLFRFHKAIAENQHAFIEFQTLYNPQSELSHFRINLLKNSIPDARAHSPQQIERSLAEVIWHEYNARVLPADDYWWVYKHQQDLGHSLYEAGKLLFGYGVPWLEG